MNELFVLMRTYTVYNEENTIVLGVFDESHIEEARLVAEKKYDKRDIWVDDFELNDMNV